MPPENHAAASSELLEKLDALIQKNTAEVLAVNTVDEAEAIDMSATECLEAVADYLREAPPTPENLPASFREFLKALMNKYVELGKDLTLADLSIEEEQTTLLFEAYAFHAIEGEAWAFQALKDISGEYDALYHVLEVCLTRKCQYQNPKFFFLAINELCTNVRGSGDTDYFNKFFSTILNNLRAAIKSNPKDIEYLIALADLILKTQHNLPSEILVKINALVGEQIQAASASEESLKSWKLCQYALTLLSAETLSSAQEVLGALSKAAYSPIRIVKKLAITLLQHPLLLSAMQKTVAELSVFFRQASAAVLHYRHFPEASKSLIIAAMKQADEEYPRHHRPGTPICR